MGLQIYNDEFNKHLIAPESTSLFDCVLHNEEQRRFEHIKARFRSGEREHVMDYAKALLSDEDLFAKLDGPKKTIIRTFAFGGCNSPLCDQVLFLYEWLLRERPDWLLASEGKWLCNPAR